MKTQNKRPKKMDVVIKRPHTFFDEDPASIWCYHREAHLALLDIPKAADAFQQIAKQELANEAAWISDHPNDLDYDDSHLLSGLSAEELVRLCRVTALALERPGFRRSCLEMEELLFRCIYKSLNGYGAGLSPSKAWTALIEALVGDEDYSEYEVLSDLFWDYDWEIFKHSPEGAKGLAEDLKALW